MKILGISCHYHEAAAALIIDGKVMAAGEEERFSRKKHDAGFPVLAIDFCLSRAGIAAKDLDYVVFYEKPFRKFERNIVISSRYFPTALTFFVDSIRNSLTEKLWIKSEILTRLGIASEKILFVPQHLSHAAASFYPSPFEKAAVMTLDGVGEWTTGALGTAGGHRITMDSELRFPHSVGLLYSAFTAFLGFEVNDGEYKVMGMAGYGRPKHVNKIRKLYTQFPDGSIQLHLKYFSFHTSNKRMYTDLFIELFSGLDRFDLAASIQQVIEEMIVTMANHLYEKTKLSNLVYGGGVALNSVVNALLLKKTPFKQVFIFPAAGDDGAAVGAALYVYHHVLGHKKRQALGDVFWGREYSRASIETFLKDTHVTYKKMSDKLLLEYITAQLKAGKVVGWFEGRAEFGPRALGHRSILADPKNPKMKDIVNSKIKFREEFRPFAPVILEEHTTTYYPDGKTLMSPYMLATFDASSRAKRAAAATVHVDGTSRIQTVGKKYPGRYRKLLEQFYKKQEDPYL